MIGLDEAYAALAETFAARAPGTMTESLATEDALGRVLAEPVSCRIDSPPFNASAMDGVAFRKQGDDLVYKLAGTVAAGDVPGAVKPGAGECVRIMTGAPLPPDTDTVVMVEHIIVDGDRVSLAQVPQGGTHIRYRGENINRGDVLFGTGTRIHAGTLAGLLSQGIRFVPVLAPLRVGIGSTGDEIVDYRRPLQPGQIYNSNSPAVAALLASASVRAQQLGTFADSLEETARCLAANTDLDLLVFSGGVSMGSFDMVPKAAEMAGFQPVFHKVKMKPGKPVWFGVHPSGTLFFGLPGNPVSALVGSLLFVRPMLAALLTGAFRPPPWASLPLTRDVTNKGGLTLFGGARLVTLDGRTHADPVTTAGSGDVARFAAFETLVRIPPATTLRAGAESQVLLSFPGPIG